MFTMGNEIGNTEGHRHSHRKCWDHFKRFSRPKNQ